MKGIMLAAAILAAGCGAVRPTLHVRDDFWADAYGFACECGSQEFNILGHNHKEWHLRCHNCGRVRTVYAKEP